MQTPYSLRTVDEVAYRMPVGKVGGRSQRPEVARQARNGNRRPQERIENIRGSLEEGGAGRGEGAKRAQCLLEETGGSRKREEQVDNKTPREGGSDREAEQQGEEVARDDPAEEHGKLVE